jgi:hypothetical protein
MRAWSWRGRGKANVSHLPGQSPRGESNRGGRALYVDVVSVHINVHLGVGVASSL